MAKLKLRIGQKFGRLEVIAVGPVRGKNRYWLTKCECGEQKEVQTSNLNSGSINSCGCFRSEVAAALGFAMKKWGRPKGGTYGSWLSMMQRCFNPDHHAYPRYGKTGITVCERWLSFDNFYDDMGARPDGLTLDRYPNNRGNYEPSNCRWANWHEQVANRTTTKLNIEAQSRLFIALSVIGRKKKDIASEFGIKPSTLSYYVRRGPLNESNGE